MCTTFTEVLWGLSPLFWAETIHPSWHVKQFSSFCAILLTNWHRTQVRNIPAARNRNKIRTVKNTSSIADCTVGVLWEALMMSWYVSTLMAGLLSEMHVGAYSAYTRCVQYIHSSEPVSEDSHHYYMFFPPRITDEMTWHTNTHSSSLSLGGAALPLASSWRNIDASIQEEAVIIPLGKVSMSQQIFGKCQEFLWVPHTTSNQLAFHPLCKCCSHKEHWFVFPSQWTQNTLDFWQCSCSGSQNLNITESHCILAPFVLLLMEATILTCHIRISKVLEMGEVR